jgi:hypothetical protein
MAKSIAQKISDRLVDRAITKFVNKILDAVVGTGQVLIREGVNNIENKKRKEIESKAAAKKETLQGDE